MNLASYLTEVKLVLSTDNMDPRTLVSIVTFKIVWKTNCSVFTVKLKLQDLWDDLEKKYKSFIVGFGTSSQ